MTDSPEVDMLTESLAGLVDGDAIKLDREFESFYAWMLEKGQDPYRADGLSSSTAKNYIARLDQLFRKNIELHAPANPAVITQPQANQLIKDLSEDRICKQSGDPYKEDGKRKLSNALQKYFLWRFDTDRDATKWEPKISFSQTSYKSADHLSLEERYQIKQAAKTHGSIPSYQAASDDEKDEINALIAQRLGKPKDEVTVSDWDRADRSAKAGSLIGTALDAGLIPIEVEQARVGWVDARRNIFDIPDEYAAKERAQTTMALTEETSELLSRWIRERRHYEMYDETDRLWLNQAGNPYTSDNLNYLLEQVCKDTEIDFESRDIKWYSLRHNVGQYMEEIGDISEANDQLRHKSIETTKRHYNETVVERRQYSLERLDELAQTAAENPGFNPFDQDGEPELSPSKSDKVDTNISDSVTSSSSSTPQSLADDEKHIDAVIKDTPEDRLNLIRQISSDS